MYQLQNGWTKQEMINAIVQGNKGCCSKGRICAYRGEDNNKCFVGVFMPDDVYHHDIEGLGFDHVGYKYPGLLDFMPLDYDGMSALQGVHDWHNIDDATPLHDKAIAWINKNVEG